MSVSRKAASQLCSQPCSSSCSKLSTIKSRMIRVMPAIRWANSLAEATVRAGCSKKSGEQLGDRFSPRRVGA